MSDVDRILIDVTAKIMSSLVNYKKGHISHEKYFALNDMKTILLKANGDFKLGMKYIHI